MTPDEKEREQCRLIEEYLARYVPPRRPLPWPTRTRPAMTPLGRAGLHHLGTGGTVWAYRTTYAELQQRRQV